MSSCGVLTDTTVWVYVCVCAGGEKLKVTAKPSGDLTAKIIIA